MPRLSLSRVASSCRPPCGNRAAAERAETRIEQVADHAEPHELGVHQRHIEGLLCEDEAVAEPAWVEHHFRRDRDDKGDTGSDAETDNNACKGRWDNDLP